MSQSPSPCAHCGAPREAGYAACRYCKTPFVADTHRDAVACPQCSTLNERGAQRCVRCHTWVVVQCVFCSTLSPHHMPACVKCGEAFAGAIERFQQRKEQIESRERMKMVGTVGTVAASFLGAVAGAAISGGSSYHGHRDRDRDSDGFLESVFGDDDNDNDNEGGGLMDDLFGDD